MTINACKAEGKVRTRCWLTGNDLPFLWPALVKFSSDLETHFLSPALFARCPVVSALSLLLLRTFFHSEFLAQLLKIVSFNQHRVQAILTHSLARTTLARTSCTATAMCDRRLTRRAVAALLAPQPGTCQAPRLCNWRFVAKVLVWTPHRDVKLQETIPLPHHQPFASTTSPTLCPSRVFIDLRFALICPSAFFASLAAFEVDDSVLGGCDGKSSSPALPKRALRRQALPLAPTQSQIALFIPDQKGTQKLTLAEPLIGNS
jgi:hypothetical protein